ncbi:hypothetical protein BPTFM16_01037 [Altererythrobacter insulae]|nr:hypothetical protein BPTFM16_01037 [Altererythrobacter insulae]
MQGGGTNFSYRVRRSRAILPFRAVNRRDVPGYEPGLQRHHLLPCQLLSQNCFGRMFTEIGVKRVGFQDFRANGLLLPANEDTALRKALPLHRGPHRDYNEMVIERVGCIEADWSSRREHDPREAVRDALYRLALLQAALRKRLLADRARFILNRKDPVGTGFDFTELDAMAEELWRAT